MDLKITCTSYNNGYGSSTYNDYGSSRYNNGYGSSSYNDYGTSSYNEYGSSSYNNGYDTSSYNSYGTSSYNSYGTSSYDSYGNSSYEAMQFSASALPAGIYLSSSGVILGTPTELTPSQTSTITVTTSGGTASVTMKFSVIAVPPSVYYADRHVVVYLGDAVELPIVNTNGNYAPIAACSISPVLGYGTYSDLFWAAQVIPAGLEFNEMTCMVSGTASEPIWPPRKVNMSTLSSNLVCKDCST